jgi:hypothetical protein
MEGHVLCLLLYLPRPLRDIQMQALVDVGL